MPRPLLTRLVVTLLVVLGLLAGTHIPPPLVAPELLAIGSDMGFDAAHAMGPLSLGIVPYLTAYVLVEIVALIAPGWRQRRLQSDAVRSTLKRAALLLGALASALQGYTLALYLESFGQQYGYQVGVHWLPSSGLVFRLLLALTLTAGAAIWVLAAEAISRWGVGNGYAVAIALSALSSVPGSVDRATRLVTAGQLSGRELLVVAGVMIALVVGVWWLLQRQPRLDAGRSWRLPTCGVVPLELAATLLMVPALLSNWFGWPWLTAVSQRLVPGSELFFAIELALVALAAPICARLFYWREVAAWRGSAAARGWWRALWPSLGCLLVLLAARQLVGRAAPGGSVLLPSLITLPIVVAIAADLWSEVRARWRAPGGRDLVPQQWFQHVSQALAQQAAARPESGAVLRGLHYRSLVYFFGPFVPIVLLAVDDVTEGARR